VNPFLSKELAGEHIRDLHESAARGVRARFDEERVAAESVSVRPFAERDIDGIRRLSELDEKPVPTGGVLVAEQAGVLVAVLPLDGGEAIADPFKPTASIVELLRMRARQLQEKRDSDGPRLGLTARLHAPRRRLA
jgi:hypothetical protein